jgi:MHS family proline/betaine transporter-like MFS transporter
LLSSLGSGLEYYDFVLYGMMAPYLGSLFFPSQSSLSVTLQVFSVFALGYVVRPLGGLLFGAMADRYGRRRAFLSLMILMALSTLIIGLLPTYAQGGWIAPFLLIGCRLAQGLSFGAELPGAVVMVTETSQEKSQGKGCSWVISSTSIGALLASLFLYVLSSHFSKPQILEGAWRLPFLFAGILAVIFFFFRKSLKETPEFLKSSSGKATEKPQPLSAPFLEFIKGHGVKGAIGFFLALFPASLIVTNLYFPIYMKESFGYAPSDIYKAITIGLGIGVFMIPFFGWVEDQLNRLKFLMGVLVVSFLSAPFFWGGLKGGDWISLVAFMVWYQAVIGAAITAYLPVLTNLFPTQVRYTGVAFSYNMAYCVGSLFPLFIAYGIERFQTPAFLGVMLGATGLGAMGACFCLLKRK